MSCRKMDMYKNHSTGETVYICKKKGVITFKDCNNCNFKDDNNLRDTGSCSYCGRDNCGC